MDAIEFFQSIKTPATILHVLGVVLGMGGALVSDMLFSFFSKDKNLNKTELKTLSILSKLILYSLILISFSGLVILLSNPQGYLTSAKFMAKMSVLAVLILNGYLLNKYIWPHLLDRGFFTLKKERNIRRMAFVLGAVSVISWLSVFVLGMLDSLNMGYRLIISIYTLTILCGSAVALLIEKRELN